MTRMERQGCQRGVRRRAAVFVPLAALSGPPQSQEAWAAQAVTWGVVATPWVFAARIHDPGPQPRFDGGELPDRRWYLAAGQQPTTPQAGGAGHRPAPPMGHTPPTAAQQALIATNSCTRCTAPPATVRVK